jgi:uncharacterized protein YbjT (DUF2867 family)
MQLGERVRCLARRPEAAQGLIDLKAEVAEGDLLDTLSLTRAMRGVDTAYYLVHSMGSQGDFESLDRQAAENFIQAASSAGVRRIIYLGGLAEDSSVLSQHLRSRHEVGKILRGKGAQVIEFRASLIIGSGSLSFELVRALVERLPVMVCPRWVRALAQPISIGDVLAYLTEALEMPLGESCIYEIGGPDRVSYADIMREYARQRGLSRLLIPVPVLTPYLSSLWLGLVTPMLSRIGRRLIEGVRSSSVVRNAGAISTFQVRPIGLRRAIHTALKSEETEFARMPVSELAGLSAGGPGVARGRVGNRIFESHVITLPVSRGRAFSAICRIGGATGWSYRGWLWHMRGLLDVALGGKGMRLFRHRPDGLSLGDRIGSWRVVGYADGRWVRLKSEMKLPGRAWLELDVTGQSCCSTIRQTAVFDPKGALGLLHWHLLKPLHTWLFRGMLIGIGRFAENATGDV